jgi:hypothetical protein
MAGGYEKASFTNDDTGANFQVQFNPKEFKLDESAAWKDSEEFQQEKPLLTFDRGKPSTLSMDLIFDTTDTGQCVELMFVREMRSLLSVTVKKTEDNKEIKRPPHVIFKWKDFEFECVCEKIGVVYLMFKADGTPLRAKVTVSLKQRRSSAIETLWTNVDPLSAMQSMLAGQKGEVREDSDAISGNGGNANHSSNQTTAGEVKGGETANQIAHKYGQEDFRPIAAANGWEDPMEPPPGPMVVPADAVAAAIFAHLNKSESPAAWGDTNADLHPDSDNADLWDVEMGDFEHGVSEGQMEFSSYEFEGQTYGEDNEAVFSDAYGGDVEAGEITHGESSTQEFSEGGAVEFEYGEENEAVFSDAYSGDVEAGEYVQGESEGMQEVSEGVEVDYSSGAVQEFSDGVEVDHTAAAENEASFSAEYGGDVEAGAYTQGESEGMQEVSEGVTVDHSAAKENEASFSDTKSGDVEKNEITHENAAAEEVAGAAANDAKGAHTSDSSAGGAAAQSDKSNSNDAAQNVAAGAADKGGEAAGSAAGDAAAEEVAGGAADKAGGAAADGDKAAGAAGGKVAGAPKGGAAGNKAAEQVAGDSAKQAVDSGPPPETLSAKAPAKEDRPVLDQVNSDIGNATLAAQKLDDAIDEALHGGGLKETIENTKARVEMVKEDFSDENG